MNTVNLNTVEWYKDARVLIPGLLASASLLMAAFSLFWNMRNAQNLRDLGRDIRLRDLNGKEFESRVRTPVITALAKFDDVTTSLKSLLRQSSTKDFSKNGNKINSDELQPAFQGLLSICSRCDRLDNYAGRFALHDIVAAHHDEVSTLLDKFNGTFYALIDANRHVNSICGLMDRMRIEVENELDRFYKDLIQPKP